MMSTTDYFLNYYICFFYFLSTYLLLKLHLYYVKLNSIRYDIHLIL